MDNNWINGCPLCFECSADDFAQEALRGIQKTDPEALSKLWTRFDPQATNDPCVLAHLFRCYRRGCELVGVATPTVYQPFEVDFYADHVHESEVEAFFAELKQTFLVELTVPESLERTMEAA